MRRVLKVVAVLLAVLLVAAGALYAWAQHVAHEALDRTWTTHDVTFPIPFPLSEGEIDTLRRERLAAIATTSDAFAEGADPAALPDPIADLDLTAIATERAAARGKHLLEARLGCDGCHGPDLGGHVIIDVLPMVGRWVAPNLTSGGRAAGFSAADWDRAVRHGVLPGNKTSSMPSGEFLDLSDHELSDVIVYLKSLPPVQRQIPELVLGPMFLSMIAMDVEGSFAAFGVDHQADHAVEPPLAGPTAEYGAHVGQVCEGCHGKNLSGGVSHGDPEMPPVPNLTVHETGLKAWTEPDFVRALREGKRPDGTTLDPHMPWEHYTKMTDAEIAGLWAWLQSLPALPTGTPQG